jgi:ATP-dependent 26S proteasome regulatory subunit
MSDLIHHLINLGVPYIQNYTSIDDTRSIMSVTAILHIVIAQFVIVATFCAGYLFNWFQYNTVSIKFSDPYGPRIMNYITKHHQSHLKNINFSTSNKKKDTVEELKKDIKVTFEKSTIYINIKTAQPTTEVENKNKTQTQNESLIYFKSRLSVDVIKKFIEKITNEISSSDSKNVIDAHYIKEESGKDYRDIYWVNVNITTNKELKYVFVSNQVQTEFCDRVKSFIDGEQFYKERGLPYKKSFLLHGPPGCGKTSLIKAISIEYNLPIFIFNISSLKNDDLICLLFDLNKYLKKSERYIILLEDFDRVIKNLQPKKDRYGYDYGDAPNSNLTIDCILNFLDGIDESYGRLTLITANDIEPITSNDALCRPGRIDHMVKLDCCNKDQVRSITNIYEQTLTDEQIEEVEQTSISPAKLINFLNIYSDKDQLMDNIITKKEDDVDLNKGGISFNTAVSRSARRRSSRSSRRQAKTPDVMNLRDLNRKKKLMENAIKRTEQRLDQLTGKDITNDTEIKMNDIEKKIVQLKKQKIQHEKEQFEKLIKVKVGESKIKAQKQSVFDSDTYKEKNQVSDQEHDEESEEYENIEVENTKKSNNNDDGE